MAPVLVPVTFPSGVTYQALVRQFIGVGTLNVKTARGEVKAESTDIIMTFEDDPDSPENQDNFDDIRAGKTSAVFPLDFFLALFPDAPIVQKMGQSDRVSYDALGEAAFIDAEGRVTNYEGEEIEDTPENRARWSGLWFDTPVVNGPRVQTWPFRPVVNNDLPEAQRLQMPKDQGALNRLLIDKVFPGPEIDNTLPDINTEKPPRPDQTLPPSGSRPSSNPPPDINFG